MTEIEKALLDALESLQSEHEQQLSSFAETLQSMRIEHAKGSKLWAEAAAILQGQYERSQTENMALSQQVQSLS
ncbi:MbeD/MobD family mobilization/exclusion protein, partial [Pseudomonas helleri]